MSSGSEPLKYLLSYPFSVLTVAKTHILILSVFTVCAWQWRSHPTDTGLALFVVPIFHLLSCAAALISLWFMVQKFYWRNVEMGLDIAGLTLIVSASLVLSVTGSSADSLRGYVMVNNMLVIIAWSFCLFWCRLCTSNNVSNLFISEWDNIALTGSLIFCFTACLWLYLKSEKESRNQESLLAVLQ